MKLPVWLSAAYAFTNGMAKTEALHALTPLLCIQNSILWCAMLFICNINGERWHEMGVPVYKSPGNIAAKKLSPRNPGTMDRPLIDIFITRAVLAGTAGFLFSGISRFSLTFVRGTSILIT